MSNKEIKISKNIQQWEERIIEIFPRAIPDKCIWKNEIDILNILFTLCYKNSNNIFYPNGQVSNLYGVDFAKEDKYIELITEDSVNTIKPNRLSFHFYDNAFSWSYFRLETDDSAFLIFARESAFKRVYNKDFNYFSEEELSKKIKDLIGIE